MGAHDQDHMRAIFTESLRPFAEALREYAVAAADRPALPSADSEAMRELSDEKQWAIPDWKEPARNAHSYGRVLCHHLIDHADSYAAIAAAAWLGPSFAHASILRSVMVSAARLDEHEGDVFGEHQFVVVLSPWWPSAVA